jgi:hypothetical protein
VGISLFGASFVALPYPWGAPARPPPPPPPRRSRSRNMNRYFLLIACLQLIKDITPVNPLTTWLPLIVIFGITAIKELTDDLGRRKADVAANSREYHVLRDGRLQKVRKEGECVWTSRAPPPLQPCGDVVGSLGV